MAKKDTTQKTDNKDVATDQKDIKDVAGTQATDTETTQVDSQEKQATQVSPASGENGSLASGDNQQGSGDSTETSSGENSEMDTQTENKGTGEQGGEAGSEIKPAEIDPEKVREIVIDEMSRALSMSQDIVDAPVEPKADTEKRQRIADDVFKKNSRCHVLHFTSDFVPFFNENDAIKNTRKLADKTIITIKKQ